MDNKLLNRLTKQDIGEIRQTMFDLNKEIRETGTIPDDEMYCTSVLRQLKKNTSGYKPLCKDRYKVLLELAEKVTEHHHQENRQFTNVLIRCLVSTRLREEGYTLSEIGRAMNKHHSTVVFYTEKMNDMLSLPLMYANEVRIRSLFNYEIEEHDGQE